MTSSLFKDIGEYNNRLAQYEQAPLRELEEQVEDIGHLLNGQPDQCIYFWPPNVKREKLENLRDKYLAKMEVLYGGYNLTPEQDLERRIESLSEVIAVYGEERAAELRDDASIDREDIRDIIREEMDELRAERDSLINELYVIQGRATPTQEYFESDHEKARAEELRNDPTVDRSRIGDIMRIERAELRAERDKFQQRVRSLDAELGLEREIGN